MRSAFITSKYIFIAFMAFTISACSKNPQTTPAAEPNQSSQAPTPPVTPPPPADFSFQPLLWEANQPGTRLWSNYIFNLINGDAKALLEAQDFDLFCPKYKFLTKNEKINAAGMLISAIVHFESRYKPTARMKEPSLGTDPITGQTVYSEGLMQLSYQDMTGWSFCKFDWQADRKLSATDPRKTIFDPYKNLNCGVRILSHQVEKRGTIVLGSGAYWSVLKENGHFEKINEIASLVNTLKFCH